MERELLNDTIASLCVWTTKSIGVLVHLKGNGHTIFLARRF